MLAAIASVALLLIAPDSQAQPATPAAKASGNASAPKAAGAAPVNASKLNASQVGLASGERLMTRDELRTCLKRSDDLVVRRDDLERTEPTFENERKKLEVDGESLTKDKESLRQYSDQRQTEFKARTDALTARMAQFRERTATDGSGRGRVQSRSELAEIERERVALDAAIKSLNADRDLLIKDLEDQTRSYNARAEQRDGRVASWRERLGLYKQQVAQHEADVEAWRKECGNRPYREEDERAIRGGK